MSEEKKADEPPQDVAEDNKAEDAVPVLPPGVKPFFVSDSHAQKLGMKTGEGIVDLLPSKFFNKEDQIAQVVELGFMCAFDPVMKEMKEVSGQLGRLGWAALFLHLVGCCVCVGDRGVVVSLSCRCPAPPPPLPPFLSPANPPPPTHSAPSRSSSLSQTQTPSSGRCSCCTTPETPSPASRTP